MTTAAYTWPTSLPQVPLVSGYGETLKDSVIRSDMDTGPSKTRSRYTRTRRLLDMSFVLTDAQKATFVAFMTTIRGGALPFNFKDPATGTATAMLMTKEVSGPVRADANAWRIAFQVEVLP